MNITSSVFVFNLNYVLEVSVDRTVIRALEDESARSEYVLRATHHQSFLDIGIREPAVHLDAWKNKVDPTAEIARPGIDLLLPVSIHALPVGMKVSDEIHEDWILSTFIPLTNDFSADKKLVEDTPIGSTDVLFMRHAILAKILCRTSRVNLTPGNVEITHQHDALAHLDQITNSTFQSAQKAIAEVVTKTVGVCRTVDAEEDKSRELYTHATAFRVEKDWINA